MGHSRSLTMRFSRLFGFVTKKAGKITVSKLLRSKSDFITLVQQGEMVDLDFEFV